MRSCRVLWFDVNRYCSISEWNRSVYCFKTRGKRNKNYCQLMTKQNNSYPRLLDIGLYTHQIHAQISDKKTTTIFYIFIPTDLDHWALTFWTEIYSPRYSPRIRGHVFAKFEVSAAFRFRVNRRHATDRRTDGRTGCNVLCGIVGAAA